MPRTLTEPEFDTIKAKILAAAPEGLKEDEFNRYVGPAMAAAIGEAENSPEPLTGSSLYRFAAGAWKNLNPAGLVTAALHPIDTATALVGAQFEQGKKAFDAAKAGRYSEALGHGAAAVVPVLGPAAANAGERIGSGDIAGGLGEGAALVAPVAASAARVPIGQATAAIGRTAEAVGQSAPMRRIGTWGAAGAMMHGDFDKAAMAAVAPYALQKGGQLLQRAGNAMAGTVPKVAAAALSDLEFARNEVAAGRLDANVLRSMEKFEAAKLARAKAASAPAPAASPVTAPSSAPPVAEPPQQPVAPPAEPVPAPAPVEQPAPVVAPAPAVPAVEAPAPRLSPQQTMNELAIAARRAKTVLSADDYDALKLAVADGTSPTDAVSALVKSRIEANPAAELARRLGTPSDAERTFPPNKSGLPTKPPTARK